MCVTSLLCGPRADLCPFYGFLGKRFSFYVNTNNINIYKYINNIYKYINNICHTNPYILNVTQQCPCSPVLIFRAWATCALTWKAVRYSVNIYPICDSPLSRSARRKFAPSQKLRRNHRSHLWTEALPGMVVVSAQKLSGISGKV